ncbi:MAG TPA: AraC family transcriptional regulator [Rhizomicrobium sp.]|jgi:AraC family transcriptional regulator|nr:AraC family transcriptional regulator [Rhizomicrobium sp.]
MTAALLLDQPDLIAPHKARRMHFGPDHGPRLAILNARGARFEGGGDEPELSLKWIPRGAARYRVAGRSFVLGAGTQLLLNRGQSYSLDMRESSESFVVFFPRALADAAWRTHGARDEAFPEIPAVASSPTPLLQASLTRLRDEARRAAPAQAALVEGAFALLADVAALAFARRGMAQRVPALRRTTRDELLRRVARAETYLVETQTHATLEGAAAAAALSPFHLIRVFRAVYGRPPLAFAAARRLDAARDALIMTADAIEDIARAAGYESRSAFDRAFVRQFGATPGAVRAARN